MQNPHSLEVVGRVDLYFAIAGIFLNLMVLLQIFRRGILRHFPVFTLFIAESFISGALMLVLYRYTSSTFYTQVYVVDFTISSILEFAVLVELISSALRPFRAYMPRVAWLLPLSVIMLSALLLWPVAGVVQPDHLSLFGVIYYKLQSIIAIIRILVFLAIAAFSRLLAIGWRDRELQIATGLGFYSIVNLAITEVHVHQVVGSGYHFMDQLSVISYLMSLLYWLLIFGIIKVPKKEFTRPMESFVLRLTRKSSDADSKVTQTPIVDDMEPGQK